MSRPSMTDAPSVSVRHEHGRIIVTVGCPLVPSAADLNLELDESCTSLALESESGACGSQRIDLPVTVLEDDMECQWDRATRVLTVTMRPNLNGVHTEECLERDEAHTLIASPSEHCGPVAAAQGEAESGTGAEEYFSVETDERRGRYLTAKRAMEPGEVYSVAYTLGAIEGETGSDGTVGTTGTHC